MTENEHVKLGAYHTLEIELQRPFTLYKQAWDLLDLERIRQACDPAASADLAAVLITVRPVPMHQLLAELVTTAGQQQLTTAISCGLVHLSTKSSFVASLPHHGQN